MKVTTLVIGVLASPLIGGVSNGATDESRDNGRIQFENNFLPGHGGWFSSIGGVDSQVADDFVVSNPIIADRVSWTGAHFHRRTTSPFALRLYSDANGSPSLTPFLHVDLGHMSGRRTGHVFSEREALEYSAPIPQVALAADTRYWISIGVTDSERFSNKWSWLPARTHRPGNQNVRFRYDDAEEWFFRQAAPSSYRSNQAFSIEGSVVPEPPVARHAILAIAIAKLLGGSTCRRRGRWFTSNPG